MLGQFGLDQFGLRMVAALAGALLIGGCFESEVPSYRYRLSVEVETPEGLKTGSSVIEVGATVAGAGTVVVNGRTRKSVRGEAVAVDLPDGQTLFALLRSENEIDWAANIMFLLSRKYRGDDGYERTVYAIRRHKGVRELPLVIPVGGGAMRRDGRPMLVTFEDEADPTSVQRVDPDDLAASFGEGVSLRRITVELTDDPVTTGIKERLAWFRRVSDEGGGLIPMIRNDKGRWEPAPGYDSSLVDVGVSTFSTEAYSN